MSPTTEQAVRYGTAWCCDCAWMARTHSYATASAAAVHHSRATGHSTTAAGGKVQDFDRLADA